MTWFYVVLVVPGMILLLSFWASVASGSPRHRGDSAMLRRGAFRLFMVAFFLWAIIMTVRVVQMGAHG